jgi:phosphatidyl-myo-inositol dimannoside synthase
VHGWTRLEARVVAIADAGARAYDAGSGIPTARIGWPRSGNRSNNALLNVRALAEARSFKPDVVLSAHMVCSPAAALIRKALGVPYVGYIYADEISAGPAMARFAMRHADRTIAISEHTERLALALGADAERLVRILPGVDLPAEAHRERADRPTILTIAGLAKRYKGHDVMLRAMPLVKARVPDVEWVVVGSGPLHGFFEEMAQAASLADDVRFCGFVPSAKKDWWLDRADVFAMPSRLRPDGGGGEGFGIVYLEAAAHGVPVVAGNVAGTLDAVRDGETGVLVDPTDHVRVADAIADLLLDPERAQLMGVAGRRWAERHAWPKVSRRVEDLLLQMA